MLPITSLAKPVQRHSVQAASPWLAEMIGRILDRPPLVDGYFARRGWVDAAVEAATARGELQYGTTAVPPTAEASPLAALPVEPDEARLGVGAERPRIDLPPRSGRAAAIKILIALGVPLLLVGAVVAGVVGFKPSSAMIITAILFPFLRALLMDALAARRHLRVFVPAPGVVTIEVRVLAFRRHRQLTRDNTRLVFVTGEQDDEQDRLIVTRADGKDKRLLWGFDRAVLENVARLIQRELQLEPVGLEPPPLDAAIGSAPPPPAVTPPTEPPPADWRFDLGIDGLGTWKLTRPVVGVIRRALTFIALLMVFALAVSTMFFLRHVFVLGGVFGMGILLIGMAILHRPIRRALGPAVAQFDGSTLQLTWRGLFGRERYKLNPWIVESVFVMPLHLSETKDAKAVLQVALRNGRFLEPFVAAPEPDIRWVARLLASALEMG